MDALRGTEKDFVSGSIRRAIFMLSVPMILEMVMESLFAVVDIYWVGKIGTYGSLEGVSSEDAIATVGLTEAVMFIVYALAIGLSAATTAMVARRIGEKAPERAADAAVQAMLLALTISLGISLVGILFARDILRLMGGTPALVEAGHGYTLVMLGGNASIMLIFLINAIFRGAGDASIAMRSLWLANGLNILLDPFFIFGWGPFPELGVQGAAVATTTGRAVGVAFQLFLLLRGRSLIRIGLQHLRVMTDVIRRLLRISAGGIAQYLIGSASWIFLVRIISQFGSEAVAGYTIAFRIIVFTILPSWGIANAAATLVGQNLGAGQADRAEQAVWKAAFYNMAFLLFIAIIFFVGAEAFVGLFSDQPAVMAYGVSSLRILCTGYVFYAYGMVISQAFNGAGDTFTPTAINLIAFWLVQIPLAYVLADSLGLGPAGAFWAVPISESLLAVIAIWRFRQGRWKTVRL